MKAFHYDITLVVTTVMLMYFFGIVIFYRTSVSRNRFCYYFYYSKSM